jgi:Mg/Co/Ni transporter MgtE
MTHYKLLAVPVVTEDKHLLGVVTIYDVIDQVVEEVED